ncbi:peptidyl-tRNA hydrolase II [Ramicandelaber brevisporus]|nr:peptidyl-tRNA hydrolase II [Ramicandelaber brevisporus]
MSTAATPPSTSTNTNTADQSSDQLPLTMLIVVRRDLLKTLNWSTGSVITQACHASTAILSRYRDDLDIQQYTDTTNGHLERMHKIVYETKNLESLNKLADSLNVSGIRHHVWIEQPEDIATCLATVPLRRTPEVKQLFKKCALFK